MELILTKLGDPPPSEQAVEMVERKGLGHPDTLCDALAEEVSVALSRFYLERFGAILHHNVDKVLLVGGRSRPAFGGGEVLEPIELYLAGRATFEVRGVVVPVEQLAIESCRAWLRANMRYLDPDRHVRIHCRIRPGSAELVELFLRQRTAGDWAANDTSCGTGFAPFSPLESLVLRLERELRSAEAMRAHPERGEDIKVMAVRHDAHVAVTLADALVGRAVPSLAAYRELRDALRAEARTYAGEADVVVNASDDLERGSVYLTVTGTSAEAGDDGQTGRGNRASGLITPYRPMSMEAVAGKNPVSHVGKIYNVAAFRMANELVRRVDGLRGVTCQLVSRIGGKVRDPQMVHLCCWLEPSAVLADLEPAMRNIVCEELGGLDKLYEGFLAHRLCIA